MKELVFDPERHRYTLDGKYLPSVTQVINPLMDFTGIPPHVLEAKRQYGVLVHETVAKDIAGQLDFGDVPDEVSGALTAWWRFLEENPTIAAELKNAIVERPMAHNRLGYAGTPDIVLNGWIVIDLKTRAPKPLPDGIQIAAYEDMWKSMGGEKGNYEHRVLFLDKDGTYKFQNVKHKEGFQRFRHLLDIHNMTQEIKNWSAK